MEKMVAPRDAFGKALVELGKVNKNVVVLDGDLANTTKTGMFAEKYPERFFQVGIAEQNMMSIAAGLATIGKIPFATTLGALASKRACDQVSISIAYPRLNVKVVGVYVGLFTGKTGATHQSIQDMAIMRSMPNMMVVSPADGIETEKAVRAVSEYVGPVYLRLERDEMPLIYSQDHPFTLGKGVLLKKGEDLTIISTGVMVAKSIQAAVFLEKENIKARVINIHTIKPIDKKIVIEAAYETGAIVTAENHNIIGGLGSAIAEILVEEVPIPMKRVGIIDRFGESGSNEDLLEMFKMRVSDIIEAAKIVLKKKRRAE